MEFHIHITSQRDIPPDRLAAVLRIVLHELDARSSWDTSKAYFTGSNNIRAQLGGTESSLDRFTYMMNFTGGPRETTNGEGS